MFCFSVCPCVGEGGEGAVSLTAEVVLCSLYVLRCYCGDVVVLLWCCCGVVASVVSVVPRP